MAIAAPAVAPNDPIRGPHPYQLLPSLTADERAELERSMREVGFDPAYPVIVDEGGAILDGHHRAEIATALGIPYPTTVKRGLSEAEKRIYAVTRNSARRQLTDAQKALAGKKIEKDVAAEAKRRQGTRTDLDTSVKTFAEVRRTDDEVAAAVGLGTGQTYYNAKKTLAAVDELAKKGALTDRALPAKLANGQSNLKQAREEVRKAQAKDKKAEATRRIEQAMAATAGSDLERAHRRANLLKTLSSSMQPLYETAFRVEPQTVADLADAEVRARLESYFADFARWRDRIEVALKPSLRVLPITGGDDATRDA